MQEGWSGAAVVPGRAGVACSAAVGGLETITGESSTYGMRERGESRVAAGPGMRNWGKQWHPWE